MADTPDYKICFTNEKVTVSDMKWVETPITKEQYEEGSRYTENGELKKRKQLAEEIAGMEIVCGYGLYGYSFKKCVVEGEEKYFLAMHIGNTCD